MERHKGRQGRRWNIDRGPESRQQHHSRGSHIEAVMRHAVHQRRLTFAPRFRPELEQRFHLTHVSA
jgi:hypothetical protein